MAESERPVRCGVQAAVPARATAGSLLWTYMTIFLLQVGGCSQSGLSAAGTVTADGIPVDSGTITFQSAASPHGSFAGIVENGAFQLVEQPGLVSGEYRVIVEGFRKTGRVINDLQKGEVAETISLVWGNPPPTITLTKENAHEIHIDLKTKKG